MKNKKIILFLLFSSLFFNLFSAENKKTDKIPSKTLISKKKEETPSFRSRHPIFNSVDLFFQFEPLLYLSPESEKYKSNTFNIKYSATVGVSFPRDFFVSFQPSISFFTLNHSWYGESALPTEIENRTTTTFSFLLNLPAAFNLILKKSRLQLSLGPVAFIRGGALAAKVKKNDFGVSGTALSDVKLINQYFWDKGRWFYLYGGLSYLVNITPDIKVGPTINAYIPIIPFIENKTMQDFIFTVGLKICL